MASPILPIITAQLSGGSIPVSQFDWIPAEKQKILAFIENRRNKVNATKASLDNYNIVTDSCSTHISEALQDAGIDTSPLYGDMMRVASGINPVTTLIGIEFSRKKFATMPRDLAADAMKSGRVILKRIYPKWEPPAQLPSKAR